MDAKNALDDLLRVSDDVRAAVVFERGGESIAATVSDDEARELAGLADAMLAHADTFRDRDEVRQVDFVTPDGDVYVLREGDRTVVAVAAADSLTGLVHHDLRTLLRSLSGRRRRAKASAVS